MGGTDCTLCSSHIKSPTSPPLNLGIYRLQISDLLWPLQPFCMVDFIILIRHIRQMGPRSEMICSRSR